MTVDALLVGDQPYLVDGGEHLPLHGDRRVTTRLLRHRVEAHGQQPGAPTAVASRRTEPRDLGLHHGDAQARVTLLQVVGGPQAGEAGADDGHVDVDIGG